ncbi:hypothetical protein [Fluviicola taffensis]|nr:hypothetical protein [Fluviicola taffensis]
MMKQLSELSLDELIKHKAKLKSALIGLAIMTLLLVLIYCYIYFFKAKSITFIPLIVLPITWIPLFVSLKNIRDEIKFRDLKNS